MKLVISISLLLSGCYLSHGLEARDAAPPVSDAGPARLDAGVTHDAGPPRLCEWVPGDAVQLTFPPGDETPLALEWSGERFLVLFRSTNDPAAAPGVRLLALDTEGRPVGEETLLFSDRPSGVHGGASMARAGDRVAAITWDEGHGCRFATIDARGAPRAERAIASPRCGSLRESATALEMVAWQREEEARSLVRLDLDGAITARGPDLEVFASAFWWGRAVTAGSSGLILAMREGVEPSEVWAQRVVELEPIEPAFRWRVLDRPASRIGVTPRRDGTLVGWLEGASHDSQERILAMAALGPDARWLAEPAPISDVVFYRDAGWSMSAFEDLHVVIAVEDRARDRRGEEMRLWLVPVDASARAVSSAISLHDGTFVRTPIVRAHPNGALVVFRGTGPTSFTGEVFALPVRCVR